MTASTSTLFVHKQAKKLTYFTHSYPHMCYCLDLCHAGHSGKRLVPGPVLAFVAEQRSSPARHLPVPSPQAMPPGQPSWDLGGQSVRAKPSRCHVRSRSAGCSSHSQNLHSPHQATGRTNKPYRHISHIVPHRSHSVHAHSGEERRTSCQ